LQAVVHVARDVGMTAVEAERACGAVSEGGRFVWHLRCDRRGLEGETRRDAMRWRRRRTKRGGDGDASSVPCAGAVTWSKLGDPEAAHDTLHCLITLRTCDYNTRTPPQPSPSFPHSVIHNPLPPFKDLISSLLVRWPISRDPFLFKAFSNLPCCGTRKRPASIYPNIPLPCNSRVATPSRTLINFCKIKQRTSKKVEGSPKSMRSIVSILTPLLSVASLPDAVGLVC